MGRHVEADRGWKHLEWLKRMVKDNVVQERFPTHYCFIPRRIEIPIQGWTPPGMKVFDYPLIWYHIFYNIYIYIYIYIYIGAGRLIRWCLALFDRCNGQGMQGVTTTDKTTEELCVLGES